MIKTNTLKVRRDWHLLKDVADFRPDNDSWLEISRKELFRFKYANCPKHSKWCLISDQKHFNHLEMRISRGYLKGKEEIVVRVKEAHLSS